MKRIVILMAMVSSLLLADIWRDPQSGIVVDTQRYLQWQDDYSDNGDTITKDNWESAIAYCEALTLGEHEDWRLPNVNELLSLVDYDKSDTVVIVDGFEKSVASDYWSATSKDGNYKYSVDFTFGTASTKSDNGDSYIRCVRAGRE